MSDNASRGTGSPAVVKHLRIPLVMVTALLTMGSGMGNPGCGGLDDGKCKGSCAIDGTYVMRFEDTQSFGADCASAGITLPEGAALVIDRDGDTTAVYATLGDLRLTGNYYGSSYTGLDLSGGRPIEGRDEARFLLHGFFEEAPEKADSPSKFVAIFSAGRVNSPEGTPPCDVRREFTATR